MANNKIGEKPTICFVPEFSIRKTGSGEFVAAFPAFPIDGGYWEIQVLGDCVLDQYAIPGHRIEKISFPGKLTKNSGVAVCRIVTWGDGFAAIFLVGENEDPVIFNAEPDGNYGFDVELPATVVALDGGAK